VTDALGLITIDGLPLHPLVVHATVILLPLTAVCSVAVAIVGHLRRRYSRPVLILAAVAIGSVPVATFSGEQLKDKIGAPGNAVLERHAGLAEGLLPFALAFGVLLVVALFAGRLADREREAEASGESRAPLDTTQVTIEPVGRTGVSKLWRRVSLAASVLLVLISVWVVTLVVMIGHSGAFSHWSGFATG
jgi:uncharacterized membrane protein